MIETLKKRREFLAASQSKRISHSAFVLQALDRHDDHGPRVGFTCSKKVGNAVARNRAKRRLREAARLVILKHGRSGHDYVLIGRRQTTATIPFAELCDHLAKAVQTLSD